MPTVQRPLTDAELESIHAAITDTTQPVDALIVALRSAFEALLTGTDQTWDDFTSDNPLDGREYALPDTQWVQIGEWLGEQGRHLDPIGKVNLTLDWMNLGPSSYKAVGVHG